MSDSGTTLPPSPQQPTSYDRATHLISMTLLVSAPLLLLLPPRKLDLYTFSLCGAFVISANHQTRSRTGMGILQQISSQRGIRAGQGGVSDGYDRVGRIGNEGASVRGMNALRERKVREDAGSEDAEEKEIGSAILDQIKEVWRVDEGKEKAEAGREDEKEDRQVETSSKK